MYCPKCGKELPEGAQFCPSCGSSISPPAVSPQSQDSSSPGQDAPSTNPQSAAAEQQTPPPVPDENIKCPKCGATGCTPQYKQNVSGGGYGCCSGGLGALVLGPLGLLCGACGRSTKTTNTLVWICPKCGHEFRVFSREEIAAATNLFKWQMWLCAWGIGALVGAVVSVITGKFDDGISGVLAGLSGIGSLMGAVLINREYLSSAEYTDEEERKWKKIAVIIGVVSAVIFTLGCL